MPLSNLNKMTKEQLADVNNNTIRNLCIKIKKLEEELERKKQYSIFVYKTTVWQRLKYLITGRM